ncbi:MAG: cob(I)alamin adenosyltransferase [Verrucomicrobiota bacterium]|jgi:cob(I)alamin adenosyltransferase
MSIATRTGDDGTTGLMYNRRVPKCDARVEACGCVDELNAALGLARATADDDFVRVPLLAVQQDLIILMGELATLPADRERYPRDGFKFVSLEMTAKLDGLVKEIEAQNVSFKGWATPGTTTHAAALDVARTTCRRAERRVSTLRESAGLENAAIGIYLNRLSDALWLLARWVENRPARE